jgi:hypothetical protein
VRGERVGTLVTAVADHAGAVGGVVVGPAFGDAGDEECGGVVAGSGYRVTHIGDAAVEVGDDLHVLAGHVFLAGEQAVVVVAFADQSDEPVDQHTRTLGAVVLLVDLRRVTQRRIGCNTWW